MLIIVFLFVNGKKIFQFKADNKSVNFPSFVSEVYIMDLVLLNLEKYL